MSTEAVVFRLYPEERTTLYVRVLVHPTIEAMRARSRELTVDGVHVHDARLKGLRGFCTEWKVARLRSGRWRRSPCIAEVNLARRFCTMEIVTHELFHATMAWARRIGFQFKRLGEEDAVNADEERIAYGHGELCRAFVVRAQAAGIYATADAT